MMEILNILVAQAKKLAGIIGCYILMIGNISYFIAKDYFKVVKVVCDDIYFFSICAGIAGISIYATGKRIKKMNYLLKAVAIYFVYCFIIWFFDSIFKTRWVYLTLGGLLICMISFLVHRHSPSDG